LFRREPINEKDREGKWKDSTQSSAHPFRPSGSKGEYRWVRMERGMIDSESKEPKRTKERAEAEKKGNTSGERSDVSLLLTPVYYQELGGADR